MARSFNGTSDKITTSAPGVTGTGARSFSFWFLTTAVTGANSNVAFGYGGTTTAASRWNVGIESGVIWDRLISGTGSWGSGYNDGKWHHCLITFPSAGKIQDIACYVDGTLLTGTYTGGTTAVNTATTNTVAIGIDWSGGSLFFSGWLAEFTIWNAQLVAPEAAALARGVNVRRIRPGSILNYWPLWGLQSPEPDLSGNQKSGTLTGTALAKHAPVTLFTRRTRIEIEPASGTSLALAAQSAAWSNAALIELQTVSLAAESAAWSNPAVSIQQLLALAAESASWSNPGLSQAATLALGQESASWTNPALVQALALALGQQSASWSNSDLTIPGGLQLAAQSASWTNPGLAVASALALAAASAGWSNPTLNEAVAIALTGQAAAWSTADLTPTSSQGVVIQLDPQSALWTANPLGLFLCPTIVNPYFGLEWLVVVPGLPALAIESCVISNTEVVTLFRKLGDGSFDGGTTIGQALRLDAMKDGLVNAGAAKRKKELDWYMWASQTGAPEVKDGDYILDSSGNKWIIWNVDVQAWGNRFFVKTKLAQ